MSGLGLIEAIHPADIIANADPDDADGDGIRGKLPVVRDPQSGKLALGRFGWKAQSATVREQAADALATDIGISSPDARRSHGDCTPAQTACLALPDGVQPRLGDTEAPDPVLGLITFYSENLAVPARRKASFAETLAGKKVFYDTGCVSCHVPKFVTRRDAANAAHAFQLIWPYSDFLLHDMGDGLADGQPVGVASGSECAHAAALGHRLDEDRQRPHVLPARRPRPEPDGGHSLAWRRGGKSPRPVCRAGKSR